VNVLFVCRGNTCRSPLAEVVARSLAPEGFAFCSAGLQPGAVVTEHAVVVAAERGYGDLSGHRPRPVTAELRGWADAVFVMEERQAALVDGARTLAAADVPDPYGADIEAYRTTCDLLEAAITVRLAELA
jgi:protein-tyrosine-phosphatase